jgi:hypothetical protein
LNPEKRKRTKTKQKKQKNGKDETTEPLTVPGEIHQLALSGR